MNQINQNLDLIAKAHVSRKPICIGELIHHPSIASQATLHAAVKKLIVKGLLIARRDKQDGRSKAVALTKVALNRYSELNDAMRYR